jgi:signal peptidase I
MIDDRADSAAFSDLASALLCSGIRIRFRAKGRSMLPTINDGDILYAESATRFEFGDIVLFREGTEFKAHRIIGKRHQGFITRGDAGMEPDGEIRKDQILGKVVARRCSRTGAVSSLRCPRARLGFFWLELRRIVARFVREPGQPLSRDPASKITAAPPPAPPYL